MDRRILKSRQAIMEAFIELLAEKSLEKIKINDIAERANVNRGTIYLHFTDKYDLQEQCINTYLQQLQDSCLADGEVTELQMQDILLRSFEFLESNATIYNTLITGSGIPVFRESMMKMVEEGVKEYLEKWRLDLQSSLEVEVQFITSAVVGLMEWWVKEGIPYPPLTMVEQLQQLLLRHLRLPDVVKLGVTEHR